MAYVVTEPCIGTKSLDCVGVCPVDCFYADSEMVYIHPDECIDCGACEPECPVDAIFKEEDVPEKWHSYIAKNAALREHPLPAAPRKGEEAPAQPQA